MDDYVLRATSEDGSIRAFAAVTTNAVMEARNIHGLSPVASAALGRTLTAAVLMARQLKGENDTLTVQFKGDGPLGGIIAVSDSKLNVRGYVYNSDVHIPLNPAGKLDVSGALGRNGYLNVIKDLGLKEPYIGYVDLISGEIAEDVTYYFAYSEQVPSVVALGVLVDVDGSVLNSGGYIIQLLPGALESDIAYLEDRVRQVLPVTTLLAEGKSAEEILGDILGEKSLKVLDKSPCRYRCNCSRERMERNILSLGGKEIGEMIQEQHGAEAQCHFCNERYWFTEADLLGLLEEIKQDIPMHDKV